MGQQYFKTCSQNNIDLFSLAQGNADAHQECKWQESFVCVFSRAGFMELRKTQGLLSGLITG
jgi:hypothetical protein